MLREITKGQLLVYHLGKKKDDGTWFNEQISLAKMNNVDIALEIARIARDIHGANGILDEYPVMRHMANPSRSRHMKEPTTSTICSWALHNRHPGLYKNSVKSY